MHAFWSVLLIPLFVIGAKKTIGLVDQSKLNLRSGSAASIWKILAALATVLLVLYLAIDVVFWAMGASGTSGQSAAAADVSLYGIMMRVIFRGITATDFPVLQIWAGTIIGFCFALREAKVTPQQVGESSLV